MKYDVTIIYDASTIVRVEANSPEEAQDKALENAESISLCHHCADLIELGDPTDAVDTHPA